MTVPPTPISPAARWKAVSAMPRRGELKRNWVQPEPAGPALPRIGVRRIAGRAHTTSPGTVVELDPSEFVCATLVAELADELVGYAELEQAKVSSIRDRRTAITELASWIDRHCDRAAEVSLGASDPDLSMLIWEWVRTLPAGYPAGSNRPQVLTRQIRTLMSLRAQREDVVLADGLRRMLEGAAWMSWGRATELDEFTRAERNALVRAAWADVRAVENRLETGRKLLAQAEGDPRQYGFTAANLLWALAEGGVPLAELRDALPPFQSWSAELTDLIRTMREVQVAPNLAFFQLFVALASLVYLRNGDLQAFRVLLVAATGHAPEEVAGLSEQDVEFVPGGVRLSLVKLRARRSRVMMFREAEGIVHADHGPVNATEVIRRLLAVSERTRTDSGIAPAPLFLAAGVQKGRELRFARFYSSSPQDRFGIWAARHGVAIAGKADIRRLRKSVKVEKAVAFSGRVSDIADDHTVETFWGHYAHGTTLHLISADTINRAQQEWLDKALSGPVVIDASGEEQLDAGPAAQVLGLTAEEVDQLRTGALDMGVTSCRDPFDSPFSRAGDLCAVAPLRCLECRNAFILPSNLPQLLLFSDFLAGLHQRLAPQHFHLLWGQSAANLKAVLAERTDAEIAAARAQIEQLGDRLQLPLAAYTEFDR
jgi:hypothetical protein